MSSLDEIKLIAEKNNITMSIIENILDYYTSNGYIKMRREVSLLENKVIYKDESLLTTWYIDTTRFCDIVILNFIISKCSLSDDTIVYRALDIDMTNYDKEKERFIKSIDEISESFFSSFTSTSKDISVTSKFAGSNKGSTGGKYNLLKIIIPKNTPSMSNIKGVSYEQEIILPIGTKYKVIGKEKIKKKNWNIIELLPNDKFNFTNLTISKALELRNIIRTENQEKSRSAFLQSYKLFSGQISDNSLKRKHVD